jgi:archaetidylinositol phosphate synthase
MIDGLYKAHLDRMWDRAAQPLARVVTANQVTLIGLVLVLASCGAFLLHERPVLLGICLAISFAADSLDGAVARLRGETSCFGGYLDAVIDRYQEAVVLFAFALTMTSWVPAFLAFWGAMMTSYAKARTAIEVPVDNNGWPDLFERQERIIYLCALLILGPAVADVLDVGNHSVMTVGLWGLALLCHATAVQRMLRARDILMTADRRAREAGRNDQAPSGQLASRE